MSGGALDYAEYKLEDVARAITDRTQRPLHRALATKLLAIAEAVHALEWELSSDTGPGDADEEIRKVIAPSDELAAATEAAVRAEGELREAIARAETAR